MDNVGLKVVLESEVAQAIKNNQAFDKSLAAMSAEAAKTTRTFGATVGASDSLTKATQKLSSVSVNANGALTGFNNIIRDAPFGIVGIGNNITQLTDSFKSLAQQTGSVRGALAATLGSLFSPAGLLTVGLSSAISLWTVYAQRQQRAASEAKAAAEDVRTLADSIKDYEEALRKNNANAVAEIVTLNELFTVARNETKSRQERTAALKELKKETNGYLDSLTLETIGTDAARKSLDEFNKSLFNSAILKANQSFVEDLAKSYGKFARQGEQGKKRVAELDAQIQKLNQPGADGLSGDERFDKVVALSKERNKLVLETNAAIKEQNRLQDEILATGTKIASLKIELNPFTKEENKPSKEIEKTYLGLKNLQTLVGKISFRTFTGTDQVNEIFKGKPQLPGLVAVEENARQFVLTMGKLGKQARENFEKNFIVIGSALQGAISPIILNLQNILAQGLANVANGLGEAIGNLVSGKSSFAETLSSLLGIMGDFIKQFGQALVTAATLKIIAEKSLVANPYLALAAGIAAIAAGQALKNVVPSFATGGIANSPMLAMIGDNPGRREAIVPSEDWREAFGGARNDGGYIAETRVKGQDLLILVKAAGKQQGRTN